jgi:hypothetical protein
MKPVFFQYIKHLDKSNATKYEIQKFRKKSPQDFCEDYSEFAYQYAKSVDPTFGNDNFFTFHNRKTLNGFAYKICMGLHQNKVITVPKAEEIETAVNKQFQ